MVADMEVHMVVDKVADMVAVMVVDKKRRRKKLTLTLTSTLTWKSNLVRELVTGLVNRAQTFLTQSLPACASSKLCEFID